MSFTSDPYSVSNSCFIARLNLRRAYFLCGPSLSQRYSLQRRLNSETDEFPGRYWNSEYTEKNSSILSSGFLTSTSPSATGTGWTTKFLLVRGGLGVLSGVSLIYRSFVEVWSGIANWMIYAIGIGVAGNNYPALLTKRDKEHVPWNKDGIRFQPFAHSFRSFAPASAKAVDWGCLGDDTKVHCCWFYMAM